jgi:hypothetical protein
MAAGASSFSSGQSKVSGAAASRSSYRLVAEPAGVAFADEDVLLDGGQPGRDLREQRQHRAVDDDDLVAGVVDDVLELLGEQPQVQRVHHRAHGRDGEVGLEVLLVVPHERADAVALLDTERRQRTGEPGGAGSHLGVRRAPRRVALPGRHDGVGVDRRAVPEDVGDRELVLLHGADDRFHACNLPHPPLALKCRSHTVTW